MPAGRYKVSVTVGGRMAVFTVSDSPSAPMEHVKM
jgi:hypothetical protein